MPPPTPDREKLDLDLSPDQCLPSCLAHVGARRRWPPKQQQQPRRRLTESADERLAPAFFLSFPFSLSASCSYLTPRSLSQERQGSLQQTLAVAVARPAVLCRALLHRLLLRILPASSFPPPSPGMPAGAPTPPSRRPSSSVSCCHPARRSPAPTAFRPAARSSSEPRASSLSSRSTPVLRSPAPCSSFAAAAA